MARAAVKATKKKPAHKAAAAKQSTHNARIEDAAPAVWVEIDTLKPWADNPRFNEGRPVEVVSNSIRVYGWGRTLGAWRGRLVWGHTARLAALALRERWAGMSDAQRKAAQKTSDLKKRWHPQAVHTATTGRVPVRHRDDLTPREAEQLAITDNRSNEFARWDMSKVHELVADYTLPEVELLGWSGDELEAMATDLLSAGAAPSSSANEGEPGEQPERVYNENEDDVPAVPKKAVTKTGDVWTLGRHTLVCGPSGSDLVGQHVPRARISLVTDPPYCSGGFQEASKSAGSVGRDTEHQKIANDRLSTRGYEALMRRVIEQFTPLDVHMFTDWKMWISLYDAASSSGLTVRSMVVWAKPSAGMGNGWRAQHELVLYGHRETPAFAETRGNVINCKRQKNELHTTQKPVELMEELVKMAEGDIIAEPFAGSGTTLIACEQLERTCFAAELDPAYCDVIVERWQNLTGGKAARRSA